TTFHYYFYSEEHRHSDIAYQRDFAIPMLAAERRLVAESAALVANSKAIVADIERTCKLQIEPGRLRIIPHGLDDWSARPATPPSTLEAGFIRLVFIGRLETRKGIDLLLEIAPELMAKYANVWLDIVGEDVLRPDGLTWRAFFDAHFLSELWR